MYIENFLKKSVVSFAHKKDKKENKKKTIAINRDLGK